MAAFSRQDLEAAVEASGGNKAALARGLGVAAPRINEWLSGKVANTKYSTAALSRAVLIAQGKLEVAAPDASATLLDDLEADARRMLDRIRKARVAPLVPPSPSQVEAAVRGVKGTRRKAQ